MPEPHPSVPECWSSAVSMACTVHCDGQCTCSCLDQEEGSPSGGDDFCLHAVCAVCSKVVSVQALPLMATCCAERTVMKTCLAAFLVQICPRVLTCKTTPAAGLVDRRAGRTCQASAARWIVLPDIMSCRPPTLCAQPLSLHAQWQSSMRSMHVVCMSCHTAVHMLRLDPDKVPRLGVKVNTHQSCACDCCHCTGGPVQHGSHE